MTLIVFDFKIKACHKIIQASLSPRAPPGFFCSQHLSVLELRQDRQWGRIQNIKLLEEQKF